MNKIIRSETRDLLWAEKRLSNIIDEENKQEFERFINHSEIKKTLDKSRKPSKEYVADIIQKAESNANTGEMLSPSEVAALSFAKEPEIWERIFETADKIKRTVYGNRIVLFAPLYVSSPCVNNCLYCGFRKSNDAVTKRSLEMPELREELLALMDSGHKRLIMVYGESSENDYEYICKTVSNAYKVKSGPGEIRRANVNAAPLFEDEYKAVHSVGIGTYQVFQETYHRSTYEKVHPKDTLKGEYDWRLFSLHRAQKAGIDDVGIGVLFGLYDWKYELQCLLRHAMALEKEFGVGPHTISYPRLEPANGTPFATNSPWLVNDDDFKKIVAIIRLMCPYTGSILTAREKPEIRDELIKKGGVSQMDAGSCIAVGGYSQAAKKKHAPGKQQFILSDTRSLDEFILSLCEKGFLPSFCTAGYREGRTGANFMPLAKHATVKNYCIANGILTFQEYLTDYASDSVKKIAATNIIPDYLKWLDEKLPHLAVKVKSNLQLIKNDSQRDLHF
jgi:2-iminoacetate synthase